MESSKKIVRLNQLFTNNFTTMLAMTALFLMIGAQGLFAQTGRANITGTVTDSQGAVVSGATVTATNTATGVAVPTTTNGAGVYNIIQIIPGVYSIRVEKEGFGPQAKENITLVAEQNFGADFALQPGKVSEKVTVEAGADLVHTETAELGQTINERTILELPLNGRNPADLILLSPGTINLGDTSPGSGTDVIGSGTQGYTTSPTESATSTNGGRMGSTYYLLDGAYNEDNYYLAAAPFPNPDATQEMSVIGNNFDPRYGFTPGGVVSIVTKSGTNDWHGDAFDFLRNGGFNAKDFFTHETNAIHRNQFGGSLGGPVVKDKFFVFGNYQGTRQSINKIAGSGFSWTPDMLNGNFSALCTGGFTNGLCNDRANGFVTDQLWVPGQDPNNFNNGYNNADVTPAYALANPTMFYQGNQLTNMDTTAVNMAKILTTGLTPINSFGSVIGVAYPSLNNFDEETIRGDYNLNDKNRISARAFLNYFNQPPVGGVNVVQTDRSWINHYQNYAGTWTWTVSPHIVNSATGFYSRMYDSSNSGIKINGKGICYSQFIATSDPTTTPCSIESLGISGGYEMDAGFPINPQNFNGINRWTYGFSDNVNISKGKHLFVAGVDFLRQYWYENTDWTALPIVGFNGGSTGPFTGSGFADFLLGDMSSWWQGGGESNVIHANMIAPYASDQIKIKPNLTFSIGLRYEPWIAPVVSSGRISYFVPGQQSTRYPNAPAGMIFPGDAGVPSSGEPSDYTRFFDPRVGIAWSPKALPNTSIRAAFGMYADPIEYSSYNHSSDLAPFSNNYSYGVNNTITTGNTNYVVPIIPFDNPWSVYPPTNFSNPFPAAFANPGTSPGASATFTTPINIQTAFAKNFTAGRTYTWNVSLEHQFGSSWLARAAYVGSESDHQPYQTDVNQGASVCGPVNGTTCLAVTNFPARAFSNFSGVDVNLSNGTASYQSGQFTLEKRFNHGLQFTANYTYSHTIDDGYFGTGLSGGGVDLPSCGGTVIGAINCNRGNSQFDLPQIFVMNFVYETPSLAGWNRATKLALGGWQLSGIYRAQSGTVMEIGCGCQSTWRYSSNFGDWAQFAPNVTHVSAPGHLVYNPTYAGFTGYLNPADFNSAGPAQGSLGNVGRNPPGAFGPGVNTWDMGMSKNFHITERYGFQFRWEMFNAFNRVTFRSPGAYQNGTAYTSSIGTTFGLINQTNPAYPSRVMQAAVKFTF